MKNKDVLLGEIKPDSDFQKELIELIEKHYRLRMRRYRREITSRIKEVKKSVLKKQ